MAKNTIMHMMVSIPVITSDEVPLSGSFMTAMEKPTWLDTR